MPDQPRPNAVLAAAVAATGLLLAALGRGREAHPPGAPARRGRNRPGRGRAGRDVAGRDPHGRDAAAPSEIPPRGWWAILRRTATEISNDRVLTEAAGITFYSLLALFPGLGAMIAIYGLFADPAAIQRHLDLAAGFVPGGGMEIIGEQVTRISEKSGGALGFGALAGLATSLWSANAAMKALVDALNVVYEEEETRGFLRRLLVTMAFTLGAILFVLLAIAAVVLLPALLGVVGLGGMEEVLSLARWPLLLAGIGLFLALVYRYGPDRAEAKWRWVSWGSAVASLAWVAGSALFSWYVSNFGNYNETYGSLGAVIGFMTWIWLSATVVLAGAELDAEMEHQTARDTTTGPEQPMGLRGARMADRVAP
jgi:membrane protein